MFLELTLLDGRKLLVNVNQITSVYEGKTAAHVVLTSINEGESDDYSVKESYEDIKSKVNIVIEGRQK